MSAYMYVGWDLSWIDGVTAEIMKKKLETNADMCKAAIEYLTGDLGIQNRRVENMVALNKQILGSSVDELKATVAFVEARGVTGDQLLHFLETNPNILTYSPAQEAGADYLVSKTGKSRINLVSVAGTAGETKVSVVYSRHDAVFSTAPISPNLPGRK